MAVIDVHGPCGVETAVGQSGALLSINDNGVIIMNSRIGDDDLGTFHGSSTVTREHFIQALRLIPVEHSEAIMNLKPLILQLVLNHYITYRLVFSI